MTKETFYLFEKILINLRQSKLFYISKNHKTINQHHLLYLSFV